MTRDEYLDSVFQIIKNNPHASGLKASTLGQLILRSMSDQRWDRFGFPSLKSLLQELQSTGKVRIDIDAQGALAVWVPTLSPVSSEEQPAILARSVSFKKAAPLRKDAWLAFVAVSPRGRRFMHRATGQIRMGLEETPRPIEQWVEINRIADEVQKSWAKDFLKEKNLGSPGNEVCSALTSSPWYSNFFTALRAVNSDYGYEWNRRRSERVADAARLWCKDNTLDLSLVFQDQWEGPRLPRPSLPPPAQTSATLSDETRRVILSALSRMTTDELLQLPIPARYVLAETNRKSS